MIPKTHKTMSYPMSVGWHPLNSFGYLNDLMLHALLLDVPYQHPPSWLHVKQTTTVETVATLQRSVSTNGAYMNGLTMYWCRRRTL